MRCLMPTLVLCITLGTTFVPAGTALGQGRVSVPLQHFVLTKRDVPASFRQVGAGSLSNAQADRADHLLPGTFERHGRVGSYQTSFRFVGRQFASVQDDVIAFKSTVGAHWEYRRLVGEGHTPLAGQPFQGLKVQHLGSEAAGFVYRESVAALPVNCGIVIFRQGVYTTWVVTCGFAPTYLANASPALARIIDKRIRSTR
jgi:hypothetical protein